MLDLLGAFEDMPEWEEIADQLFNAGQTLNPSELHGALVGLMGAGFNPDDQFHLNQTLASAEKAVGVQYKGILLTWCHALTSLLCQPLLILITHSDCCCPMTTTP